MKEHIVLCWKAMWKKEEIPAIDSKYDTFNQNVSFLEASTESLPQFTLTNIILRVYGVSDSLTTKTLHSSLESGSNPKVKTQPKFQWNLVWPCMLVEKNLSRKNSIGGPSRKFKNLARKRKILKFFWTCIWTQVWLSIISKKISKFLIFWPNFFHGAHMPYTLKKIFPPKCSFLSIISFRMSIFIVEMRIWYLEIYCKCHFYTTFLNSRSAFQQ